MGLSVAYKNPSQLAVVPEEAWVRHKPVKQKSIYTIAREQKFKKAALKKYADRISAIQQVFPDWNPAV